MNTQQPIFFNNTFTNITTTSATMTTGTGSSGIVWSPSPRYWYKIDRRECSICGKVYETRKRMLNPRPAKREDRVSHRFIYDYCG